jgi:hypothetical protein
VKLILKLVNNETDDQGGLRAISSLIHQTGLVLNQKILASLPDILNAEYVARVPHPTSATTAAMPAMSAFIKTVDSRQQHRVNCYPETLSRGTHGS